MADYRVLVGTELDTSGINTALKNYKGKINVGATLDTSSIVKAINSFKSSPIRLDAKLNTDGITAAIRGYVPPKKIHLESELSTAGINKKIEGFVPSKPIKVDVELTKSSINEQIRNTKPTETIKIKAELDKNAISNAIKGFDAGNAAKIRVGVDPSFEGVEAKIKNYIPRVMMQINAKVNKTQIDESIKNFKTSAHIKLKAELPANAIEKAVTSYKAKPVPIAINFRVGSTKNVDDKIAAYKKTPIDIQARLIPASKDFTKSISNTPVKISATVEKSKLKSDIEAAIGGYVPKAQMPVNIKLTMPKDINGQIASLPKPTTPINVGVKLDDASVNSAISATTPTSLLNVGVRLRTDDINKQILAINPANRVVVRVHLDNSNIDEKTGKQMALTPISVDVKLNTEKINEQIKGFKTQSKVSVGVKLDLTGRNGGQSISQQINAYKTTSKLKVGVLLDREAIISQIAQVKVDAPIRLGVELDPKGIQNVQTQINNLVQQVKAIGNIRINLGGAVAGTGRRVASSVGSKGGSKTTGLARDFMEADIKIEDMASHTKSLQAALKRLGFSKSSISNIIQGFRELDVVVKSVTTRLDKAGNLSLTIKGLDEAGRAITMIRGVDRKGNLTSFGTSVTQSFKETEAAFARLKTVAGQMKSLKVQIAGLDADRNKGKIEELTSQLRVLQAEYRDLYTITSQNLNTNQLDELKRKSIETANAVKVAKAAMADKAAYDKEQQEIRETSSEYQKLIKIANSMKRIKVTLAGLDAEKDKQRIAELTSQLHTLQSEYRNLFVANKGRFDTSQLDELRRKSTETANAVKAAKASMADDTANLAQGIRDSFGVYDLQVRTLESSIMGLSQPTAAVQTSLANVKQALIDMQNASNNTELIEAERRYQEALKQTELQLRANQLAEVQEGGEDFAIKKEAALTRLNGLFENGSEASKRFGAQARELERELNNVGNVTGVDRVTKKIANLEKQVKASGLQVKTFTTRLKEQFSKYSQYISIASVFMYSMQAFRSMFEQVKLIDSAMTELKKVTNESNAAYDQFLSRASSRAKELGTTIDGLVSSTADFARLGYGFEDAQGLAEVANIYAVVGDEIEGVEGATESLISTMAAFKDEMNGMSNTEFAMSIIDKFNEIGNNFAISSGGIGEAMERSASSMMAANNTIDETIALITAANTVVNMCHAA